MDKKIITILRVYLDSCRTCCWIAAVNELEGDIKFNNTTVNGVTRSLPIVSSWKSETKACHGEKVKFTDLNKGSVFRKFCLLNIVDVIVEF